MPLQDAVSFVLDPFWVFNQRSARYETKIGYHICAFVVLRRQLLCSCDWSTVMQHIISVGVPMKPGTVVKPFVAANLVWGADKRV